MARRLGISASALSQIERDRALPSLSTMVALAKELHLSLDDLLGAHRPRHGEFGGTTVGRSRTRAQTTLGPGVRCAPLAVDPERGMRLFVVTFEPGARATVEQLPVPSASGLVAVVLAGALRLVTSAEESVLGTSDALEVDCGVLRAVRNESAETGSLLLGVVGGGHADGSPRSGQAGDAPTRGSSPARRRRG
jgi:transcriptional regulator with XRE-family HTH domain